MALPGIALVRGTKREQGKPESNVDARCRDLATLCSEAALTEAHKTLIFYGARGPDATPLLLVLRRVSVRSRDEALQRRGPPANIDLIQSFAKLPR